MHVMNNTWRVSIILLNYNGKQFNKNCIDSLLRQTYNNYEIIFVDNKSTDWSLENVEKCYKKEIESWKIKIVKNNWNLWFAWWNNSWIPFVSKYSEYIRLLNNDTEIDKNCLFELIRWIEWDIDLWAVSSLVLDRWSEKLISQKTREKNVIMTNIFWVQIWEKWKIKNDVYYTNFLCWCSFLYKKSLIDIPFFDFYKIYCEDTQLSWEILCKWYKLGVCIKSIVNHYWSATMNKMSYNKIYLLTRNSFINFLVFVSKKMRIKMFIPFFIFHSLHLLFNYKELKTLLKVDYDSIKRIRRNKDKIKLAENRIKERMIISETEFLKKMPYKLVDRDLFSGNILVWYIIDTLNFLIKIYYKIFHIPYKDKIGWI